MAGAMMATRNSNRRASEDVLMLAQRVPPSERVEGGWKLDENVRTLLNGVWFNLSFIFAKIVQT